MRSLSLFLFLSISLSAKLFTLDKSEVSELEPYYEYTFVESKDETPLSIKNRKWIERFDNLPQSQVESSYWIKIKLKNSTSQKLERYLLSERSYIYSIDYYLVKQGRVVMHKNGSYFKKEDAPIDNITHRVFPLFLDKDETIEVYFKIQSFNKIELHFKLVTAKYLSQFSIKYNFLQGIFFGVMFIMILYNLSLYFLLKFKPYLYYVLYVSAFMSYVACYLGYFHIYTSLSSIMIYALLNISIGLFFLFIIGFLQEVFEMREYTPRFSKILDVFKYFILFINFIIVYLYFKNFLYVEIAVNIFYLSLPLLYLTIISSLLYLKYIYKNNLALVYVVIWSILGLVGLLYILANIGLISTEYGFDYLFELGVLLETLLFSLMLAYRIKEIEKEKESQKSLLIQQNKLAAIGETVSLIAHQWRQPLSEINGVVLNIDVDFRKKSLNEKKLNKYLNNIEEVTAYLSQTINDFMHLSNPKKSLDKFKLKELFEESQNLIKPSSSLKFEIRYFADNKEKMIKSYKSELIQALLIVFNNSIDACRATGIDPFIQVEAKIDNGYLLIEIEDNGGGIKQELFPKIYNPYFTTKHASKGTGLGLYILKILIEESMFGSIEIKNVNLGIICNLKIPIVLENV